MKYATLLFSAAMILATGATNAQGAQDAQSSINFGGRNEAGSAGFIKPRYIECEPIGTYVHKCTFCDVDTTANMSYCEVSIINNDPGFG